MDDNSGYRDLFFEETDDHLQQLNDNVLALESDPSNKDLMNEIFRSAHTLKGMSATMGYEVMTHLTHRMEDIFELFKSGKMAITSDHISLIFRCLDRLQQLVDDLRDEKELSPKQIEDIMAELDRVAGEKEPEAVVAPTDQASPVKLEIGFKNFEEADEDVIKKASADGYQAYSIAIRLDKETALKGPRVFLIMENLDQEGDVLHTEPAVEDLEAGKFDTDFQLLYLSRNELHEVQENLDRNSEIDQIQLAEFNSDHIIPKQTKASQTAVSPATPKTKPSSSKTTAKKDPAASKTNHANHNQSIRVDLSRLDRFLNLVSELVVYRNQLEDVSNRTQSTDIKDSIEQVSRLTSELQDLVLKIRMQQVGLVFSRFPRMVRDLSNELNKEMELEIIGEDTELDKTVVSELGEPLVHILRNSADHGIEAPDVREKLGKPRKGTITLAAYQEGNRVIITVKDDGKGLDPEIIRASAEKKGIDTEGMSDDEVRHLIFNPGFSTAQKITDISGRGVGLDAVQSKISSLGGSIELKSEINVGTTFIIKLPLTLSIIQALLVGIGSESFAIPLDIVERVVMVHETDIVATVNQEVYKYQNHMIPIIRTNRLLGIDSVAGDKHYAIIVNIDKKYYGVLADELIGQQEIVIKKIDKILQNIKKYQGATILGNGAIALILDVNAICTDKKG